MNPNITTNNSVIAFLDKASELDELYSAIKHFNITTAYICIATTNRINKKSIECFLEPLSISIHFIEINFRNMKLLDFVSSVSDFDCKYVAIPISYHRIFYKSVPELRKLGNTIIHLSDSFPHAFTLPQFLLAFKVRGIWSGIKAFYSYFEYRKAIGDYCFFSLFPAKACLAKKTLPIDIKKDPEIPEPIKNELMKSNIDTLTIPGWSLSVEEINSYYEIANYCATTKDKIFIINGRRFELDTFLNAEILLRNYPIKKIVGSPSTVMYYAKTINPAIECSVVLDGFLNKKYGLFMEYLYTKQGKKLGIKFNNWER